MILNEKGKQAEKFANFLGGKSGFLKSGDSYDIVHASGHLLKYKNHKTMFLKVMQSNLMIGKT